MWWYNRCESTKKERESIKRYKQKLGTKTNTFNKRTIEQEKRKLKLNTDTTEKPTNFHSKTDAPEQRKRKHIEESTKPNKKQKTKEEPIRPNNNVEQTWQTRLTLQKIGSMWPQISNKFFTCPKKVAKFWNGVVTTDGVVASWHLKKATSG
jgi:hypothetical protein